MAARLAWAALAEGYAVKTVNRSAMAMDAIASFQPDLVILDLIMPEMGGRECLEELLKIDPVLKVVIASGFSVDAPTMKILGAKAKGFVSKPFQLKELLQAVRRVLDEPQSPVM